jgi:hypothetical protein
MPWCRKPTGPQQVVDRAPPRGQDGRAPEDQKPVGRRRGNRRANHAADRHGTRWDVHSCGPSRGFAAACLLNGSPASSPAQGPFPNPFRGIEGKRATVELSLER